MARLRTAVIGVGHLGKEHARILAAMPEVELVGVADINFSQAQAVAERCGTVAYPNHSLLFGIVDAAIIAVPTSNHFSVASDFLRLGIPLLVEKPLAASLEQAETLVQLARRTGTLLQVGHIERFNPAYEEIRHRVSNPQFIECERLGPFSGRSADIGVVLDLMIHDLDLLMDFVGGKVTSVEAVGWSVYGRHEDVAHARLIFANGCEARVSASRANSVATRTMRIWSDAGYACLDFAAKSVVLMAPSAPSAEQKLHIWNQACPDISASQARHLHPVQANGDQLTRELKDFVDCAGTDIAPRVTGEHGRDAMALASRIMNAMHESKSLGRTAPWYRPHTDEAAA